MQLQSARDLKALLTATLLGKLTETARAAPTKTTDASSLALGISRRGTKSFHLAVRCQSPHQLRSKEVNEIRKEAKDEVDVRYIGAVSKLSGRTLQGQRPLQIGTSVGHAENDGGTLACFVKKQSTGETLLLSNNHVFANENKAKKGDPILQPGRYDGGEYPNDVVAKLLEYIRLKITGVNLVDCATATLDPSIECDFGMIRDIGRLAGLNSSLLDTGMKVAKRGRTTAVTRGEVTAFELDNVIAGFGSGNLRFDNQIEIEATGSASFSGAGDSGALILNEDMLGVGLLFAGSDQGGTNGQGLTYANPLKAVLDALNVELLL